MPEKPPAQTLLEILSKNPPTTIVAFNVEIDGWHIWKDKNGVHWLDNSFTESFELPALEEPDLVNIACMMLLAYAHGYFTGQASRGGH